MKRLRARRERARVARAQSSVDGVGGKPAAEHRVIDAFARRRRDDAGGVAGEQTSRPLSQRFSGFSGIGAPSLADRRRRLADSSGAAQVRDRRFSEKPLCALPVPTLMVSPCGKIQA